MGKKENSKEQKLIKKISISYFQKINSSRIFNDFKRKVKKHTLENDGANEFLKLIDDYVLNKSSKFIQVIDKGTILYRARIVPPKKINKNYIKADGNMLLGYDETNSREAPLGFGTEGRNNINGVSYLYLANNIETACSEVKPIVRQLLSVAEFESTKELKIVNFADDNLEIKEESNELIDLSYIFASIATEYTQPAISNEYYVVTQVITDYIRKNGIDGIAYKSFCSDKGINYTFFNSSRNNISYKGSRLVMLQSERRTFLDFNNNKIVNASTIGGASYDEESATRIRKEIIDKIHDNTTDKVDEKFQVWIYKCLIFWRENV